MQNVWGVDIEESKNFIIIYIIIFFITYAVSKVIFLWPILYESYNMTHHENSGVFYGLSNGSWNNKFLLFGR